jgi:hypothetical protein
MASLQIIDLAIGRSVYYLDGSLFTVIYFKKKKIFSKKKLPFEGSFCYI